MSSKENLRSKFNQNKEKKTAADSFISDMSEEQAAQAAQNDQKEILESVGESTVELTAATSSIILKKRDRYEDNHERKTYYINKEHIKEISKLKKKTNISQSEIVNMALKEFFERLEIK